MLTVSEITGTGKRRHLWDRVHSCWVEYVEQPSYLHTARAVYCVHPRLARCPVQQTLSLPENTAQLELLQTNCLFCCEIQSCTYSRNGLLLLCLLTQSRSGPPNSKVRTLKWNLFCSKFGQMPFLMCTPSMIHISLLPYLYIQFSKQNFQVRPNIRKAKSCKLLEPVIQWLDALCSNNSFKAMNGYMTYTTVRTESKESRWEYAFSPGERPFCLSMFCWQTWKMTRNMAEPD